MFRGASCVNEARDTDLDSIWDNDSDDYAQFCNTQVSWERLSHDFANAGYREGISSAKDSALQEGFDVGYASSAAIGRKIGILKGRTSVLIAYLSYSEDEDMIESRKIFNDLAALGPTPHEPVILHDIQNRLRRLHVKHGFSDL